MPTIKKIPKIAILMCTLNGGDYLEQQLDSIHGQDFKSWILYVSDDGSTDKTISILREYQKRWGKNKLVILKGPQTNFQTNFISLISNQNIKADFYFLSDQDDIWMKKKISHTLAILRKSNTKKPFLYSGRTIFVSANGKKILGQSVRFIKKPSFKNAIVQCIAGGNTMAFNQALKNIVVKYKTTKIVSHDWWLYILNELGQGKTFYDEESVIYYRQHQKAIVGMNTNALAKFYRFFMLMRGEFKNYNSIHYDAFNEIKSLITKDNQRLIYSFYKLREGPIHKRILMVNRLGIYRQTFEGTIALYLSALLKKL